jgi:hypothetical protein
MPDFFRDSRLVPAEQEMPLVLCAACSGGADRAASVPLEQFRRV